MAIPYKEVALTAEQKYRTEVVRIGFMSSCPFFAHFFYSECSEYFTLDIPTAATDGRRIFINPEYLMSLKPMEGVFVYAHEMYHVVSRHPQRMKHYLAEGKLGKHPYEQQEGNIMADYVINADLVETGVGMINASWLWAGDVSGQELWEDVYARKYKAKPPGQGGSGQGPGRGTTWADSGKSNRGARTDTRADAQGGSFDTVLPPTIDDDTGKEDVPTETEFKEAVARAAEAAKTVGKLPAGMKRLIEEVLEPQVDWREHIRMLMTGKLGAKAETWAKPNRRYAAFGALTRTPFPIMPGRRGYGADTVAVAVDTSGSIGKHELDAFMAEVSGVLADVKPRRIIVIGCDASVSQVDELADAEDLQALRVKGIKGGGGTRFEPPFEYLAKENIKPESLIYLTDMLGSFPNDPPAYPVIWAATTDQKAPFGDVVRIKV